VLERRLRWQRSGRCPGTVISLRDTSSSRPRRAISLSRSAILPLRPVSRSNINRNMARAASGSELAVASEGDCHPFCAGRRSSNNNDDQRARRSRYASAILDGRRGVNSFTSIASFGSWPNIHATNATEPDITSDFWRHALNFETPRDRDSRLRHQHRPALHCIAQKGPMVTGTRGSRSRQR
jgi:hypothetical protein